VPLSEDLRSELAAIAPTSDCDRLAELSGLFHVAGSVHLRGRGEIALHLDLVSSAVARRAFALLRAFGVESEIRTYQRPAFDRSTRYQLHVEGTQHAYETLHRAGVLDSAHRPVEHPPQRVVARRCCRGAYLRGALLGAGSLSGPLDPHLEIRTAEIEGARFLADVAARAGAELHVLERARHAVAYAKGIEPITDVLVAAGSTDVVLVLEERSVMSATRADANRLANADHANLVRTSRAAHAQLEAVRSLDVDALPDDLRELAVLRLRHPTASVAELARRCRPPATKASAYRRLRKLQDLAGWRTSTGAT
jgi:cell division protein WhiA